MAPPALRPMAAAVLGVAAILVVFPSLFAVTTLLERKGLARMQNRLGPNRVGPFGLWQPLADGIKSLTKEDAVPLTADYLVHFLAPMLLVVASIMAYAVLPIGRNMVLADLNAGLLFFFAAGSVVELAVFMAGWSSRSKYSLLGAMRAIAQMVCYEVPLILSALVAVMAAGSLNTVEIVAAQSGFSAGVPHWFVFTPWGFAGFVLFMIAATAESNRSPFDLPEGESELIAGYYVEYSGFKFALFFLGEYMGMFATSGMAITLFLGGWNAPAAFLAWVPSYAWFFLKLLALVCVFIWVRGTLPRLRMDQLMRFAWAFMLPMAILNLFAAALTRFLPAAAERWLVCALLVYLPAWLLTRRMRTSGAYVTDSVTYYGKRSYRYAD